MKKLTIRVNEDDFGSSTSCQVFFKNSRCVKVVDTSTNESNYMWDGWDLNELDNLIGKSEYEILIWMKHRFDNFDHEFNYRYPYMSINEVVKDDIFYKTGLFFKNIYRYAFKKMSFVFCGIFIVIYTANPSEYKELVISLDCPVIRPYEKVWKAVCMVESTNNSKAINKSSNATGIVQITPIRVKDYNQRTGKHYTIKDCFNPNISKEIFMFYAMKFNHTDIYRIASDWNKCTNSWYYNLVRKFLT
jgi:Transglycosylase SLT domain